MFKKHVDAGHFEHTTMRAPEGVPLELPEETLEAPGRVFGPIGATLRMEVLAVGVSGLVSERSKTARDHLSMSGGFKHMYFEGFKHFYCLGLMRRSWRSLE